MSERDPARAGELASRRDAARERRLNRQFDEGVDSLADWVVQRLDLKTPEMSLADLVEECTDGILRAVEAIQEHRREQAQPPEPPQQ